MMGCLLLLCLGRVFVVDCWVLLYAYCVCLFLFVARCVLLVVFRCLLFVVVFACRVGASRLLYSVC